MAELPTRYMLEFTKEDVAEILGILILKQNMRPYWTRPWQYRARILNTEGSESIRVEVWYETSPVSEHGSGDSIP